MRWQRGFRKLQTRRTASRKGKYLGLPWALFSGFSRFEQKQRSFHPKTLNSKENTQLESVSGACPHISAHFPPISAHFPPISAHFPGDNLPNHAKSRFPLIFSFSAQNPKRAKKMPRAPKSDQMEDPGISLCMALRLSNGEFKLDSCCFLYVPIFFWTVFFGPFKFRCCKTSSNPEPFDPAPPSSPHRRPG